MSDHIQNVKIFKAFRNIKVIEDEKSPKDQSGSHIESTDKSSAPDNRSKRVCEDVINAIYQMKQDTKDNVIDEALNRLVQSQVCLSLSEIRLIDQQILDNIIFKKVAVGLEDQGEP